MNRFRRSIISYKLYSLRAIIGWSRDKTDNKIYQEMADKNDGKGAGVFVL